MQGLVTENGREMLYGKILGCTGLTVKPLEEQLPFPIRFVHDAECAAELERWRHPELADAVYLSLGEHLGGAMNFRREDFSGGVPDAPAPLNI